MKYNLFWNSNTLWNQSRVALMIGHRWRTISTMLPVSQRSSYSLLFPCLHEQDAHRLLAYEERALDCRRAGLLLLNCTTPRETAWPLWGLHSLSSKVKGQMEEIPLFFRIWNSDSDIAQQCAHPCAVCCAARSFISSDRKAAALRLETRALIIHLPPWDILAPSHLVSSSVND